ncbi:MAG: hypothetical protein RR262_18865, partial [Clostridium sp.]
EKDIGTAIAKMFNITTDENQNNPSNELINNQGEVVISNDIEKIKEAYTNAIESQKNGDWSKYGEYIDELGKLLDELSN